MEEDKVNVKFSGGGSDFGLTMLAIILAYIAFDGEPDLVDALIFYLMK